MSGAMTTDQGGAIEAALVTGDLTRLTTEQRVTHYLRVCESLGLNPHTQPFEYLQLNGKLKLYANKNCTDQIRSNRSVSVEILSRSMEYGLAIVTARATMPDGRRDESIGAVPVEGLKGEALANALMKAETKARRRATLSVCGLSMLDETEVDSIPHAVRVDAEQPAPPQLPAHDWAAWAAAQAESFAGKGRPWLDRWKAGNRANLAACRKHAPEACDALAASWRAFAAIEPAPQAMREPGEEG